MLEQLLMEMFVPDTTQVLTGIQSPSSWCINDTHDFDGKLIRIINSPGGYTLRSSVET